MREARCHKYQKENIDARKLTAARQASVTTAIFLLSFMGLLTSCISGGPRSGAKGGGWPVRCMQDLEAGPWWTQQHGVQATINREASSSGAVTIESWPASRVVNDQELSPLIRLRVEASKA